MLSPKRLAALVALAALAAGFAVVAGGGGPSIRAFPRSQSGIQLEMVFDYEVPRQFSFPGISAVWSASYPLRGHYATVYLPFDRDRDEDYTPAWWRAHHPDWIEYRCDRATWATEFGDPAAPLDIANPAVRQWQWSHEIVPALAAGYAGVAFDNLNLDNSHGRCGHYDSRGRWVGQFSGGANDPAYRQSVIDWANVMRAKLHDSGRTMGINFSYTEGVPKAANLALMAIPDLVFDESGVTHGGAPGGSVMTYTHWLDVFSSARAVEARGACYHLNGEAPEDTAAIPLAEREWIIGNYLLLRGPCTFVYVTGYRAYVPTDHSAPLAGRDQDYGIYHIFPEYRLPIGAPTSEPENRGGLWLRRYSGGVVVVDPSDVAYSYSDSAPLYALGSAVSAKAFSVPAHSALILLRQPAQ